MRGTALSRRLRRLAEARGVTAAALAGAAGISTALAEAVLDGDIERPSDAVLAGAARLLDTDLDGLRDLIPLALREATRGSDTWRRELIGRALRAMDDGNDGYRWNVHEVFDTYVIVSTWDGEHFRRYDYTISADGATLTSPEKVEMTFTPVDAESMIAESAIGAETAGGRWAVRIIRSGVSANNVLYPPAVLAEAAPAFDGVRVYAVPDNDHVRGRGKDVNSLVGRIARPVYAETVGGGEINAELELIDPSDTIGRKLTEAWRRGLTGLMGLSIYGTGRGRAATHDGRRIYVAESLCVESVDIVVDPGAGGEILHLIESAGAVDMKLKEILLARIRAKLGQSRIDAIDVNDQAALELLYAEAVGAPGPVPPSPPSPPAPPAAGTIADIERRVEARLQLAESRAAARTAIAASGLPAPAVERLQERFGVAESIGATDVADAIAAERRYLRAVHSGGQPVTGLGDPPDHIRVGESRAEKVREMVDALFDPQDRSVISIKEVYRSLTGDDRVTGRMDRCDRAVLAESIHVAGGAPAGRLAQVFGDSITRRMQRMYAMSTYWDWWMQIATVTDVMDFRTQRRIYVGGYGDLPEVAEGADYTALTSPTDSEETYAVKKRGGLESITLEAIKNDDMAEIAQIPVRMSRAAKRTLSKLVSSLFTMASGAGPTMHDGNALFHANHKNRGAVALSAASLAAGRLAMLRQQQQDSDEQLAIMPRYLLVPWDLQQTAHDLFQRATQNDPNFVNSLNYTVVPIPDWSDANDWVLTCDPMDCPVIELGFLDGQREPELFLQSSEQVGSLFDKDQWTYKIRHVYGTTVLDWRGLYKGLVA